MTEQQAIHAAMAYFFPAVQILATTAYGAGHIHRTFMVQTTKGRYILQQFNLKVFARPYEVAGNIGKVHDHLRATGWKHALLTPVYSSKGDPYFVDERGNYWRVFDLIEGGYSIEKAETPQHAYLAGRAFGTFVAALQSLDPQVLFETIPGFHDSAARWKKFEALLAADPAGRAGGAGEEMETLYRHHGIFFDIHALELPRRVVHNDAKIGNVLFACDSGEVLAVMDWDTVMPGLVLADFGDLARSVVAVVEEDDPRTELAVVRMSFFEALCRGFIEGGASTLLPIERENLVLGARWITLEQALRFLSDHLEGDRYYPVRYAGHNLVRARNQIALFHSMLRMEREMVITTNSIGQAGAYPRD